MSELVKLKEPNWTIERKSDGGWYVVAYTMRGRDVVDGPYIHQWQANMVKGRRATQWREQHSPKETCK